MIRSDSAGRSLRLPTPSSVLAASFLLACGAVAGCALSGGPTPLSGGESASQDVEEPPEVAEVRAYLAEHAKHCDEKERRQIQVGCRFDEPCHDLSFTISSLARGDRRVEDVPPEELAAIKELYPDQITPYVTYERWIVSPPTQGLLCWAARAPDPIEKLTKPWEGYRRETRNGNILDTFVAAQYTYDAETMAVRVWLAVDWDRVPGAVGPWSAEGFTELPFDECSTAVFERATETEQPLGPDVEELQAMLQLDPCIAALGGRVKARRIYPCMGFTEADVRLDAIEPLAECESISEISVNGWGPEDTPRR